MRDNKSTVVYRCNKSGEGSKKRCPAMIVVNKNYVVLKLTKEHTHKTTTIEKFEASKLEKKLLSDSAAFHTTAKDTISIIVQNLSGIRFNLYIRLHFKYVYIVNFTSQLTNLNIYFIVRVHFKF